MSKPFIGAKYALEYGEMIRFGTIVAEFDPKGTDYESLTPKDWFIIRMDDGEEYVTDGVGCDALSGFDMRMLS